MAILRGLNPAPVAACRVLEIGCNAGANLIPMAYAIPGSEFVGFDLAAAPLAVGQEKIHELGLTNIRLLQADILAAENAPELQGKFDYIIAHGIYAWVPATVREALLRYCREHLSANGIVFMSYAALPGAHLLHMAREIMTYRGIDPENPAGSVSESMEFLQFIARCRPEGDGYRVLLERQLDGMTRRGAEVVFHDELASAYHPVLFSDFARHAAQYGLSYFSEAELPPAKDPCYQQESAATIQTLAGGDPLVREQMLDFARMRQFRESLLCHAEQAFTYDVDMNAMSKLRMLSGAESSKGEAAGSRAYTSSLGVRIETQHPATILVMEHLIAQCPHTAAFTELAAMVGQQDAAAVNQLPLLMLRLIVSRMVQVTAWEAPVTRQVTERPLASLVCRMDALRGNRLVTLLHGNMELSDPIACKLLPLLDGHHDRAAILHDLGAGLPDVPAETLAGGLEQALETLARAGTLQAQTAE